MLHGKITLSFGLILSELLTNSFKYAFADHEDPQISINVQINGKWDPLCVCRQWRGDGTKEAAGAYDHGRFPGA